MRRNNNWYVIQVPTGKEEAMCRLIERAGSDTLAECFTPQYATQKKVRGAWRNVDAVLFPGYVIAVTDDADALNQRLSRVVEYTRMLTMGERFTPLEDSDRVWLSSYTSAGNRVIPMSIAEVDEGDCVRVLSGPLMGHEGWIRSVNRRKSLAFIEVEMFGRKIQTRIGLGVLRKRVSQKSRIENSKIQRV
ncbi:antiterminator LoaP [Collinsella tanakaei]|nr:antiterminator LoaP [Collinsella tanakaei]